MTPIIDPIKIIDQLQEILNRLYKSIPWYLRWLARTLHEDAQQALQKLEEYIRTQQR